MFTNFVEVSIYKHSTNISNDMTKKLIFAAALSSRSCMKLYGLECLEAGVQDQGSNFTRFICISKNLEIYPGADRTSLMMVLPHRPGSLYKVLSRFYALGINLNKLESRPLPDREFEFMFYFDLECSVYAPEIARLFQDLEAEAAEAVPTWPRLAARTRQASTMPSAR